MSRQRKTPPIREDAMGFIEFNQRGNYNMSKELAQSNKKLVVGINKTWESALYDSKSAMNKSVLTGDMLAELKLKTPHGEWEKLFKPEANDVSNTSFEINFTRKHASILMQISANKALIKHASNGEVLTINEMRKIISEATPEQLEKVEQLKKEEADRLALAETNKALAEAKAAIDNAKKQDDVIDGEFVEVKKPAPVPAPQIEEEFTEVEELQGLLHEQHSVAKALQEDNDSLVKIFESSDQITQALKELHIAKEINRGLEGRINGFMVETRELKKAVTYWKSRCKKLGDTNV